MKRLLILFLIFALGLTDCGAQEWRRVELRHEIHGPQPMTGLVLWPAEAKRLEATYGDAIQLEFSYCLPCKVVKGCEEDGSIVYDWSWFESILDDVASRRHQLIARFRYAYPSSRDVDGRRGTTAVPEYIKARAGYEETFAENPGGDGPTYYPDWRDAELQRFTLQFFADFAKRYAHDPRLAFLEVGFGHWAEYHTYGTPVEHGRNFPSKAFQKSFFEHLDSVADGLPWAVSINAGDEHYSPVAADADLLNLCFGTFDDSFMHKGHEIESGSGFNEKCWRGIGQDLRWRKGPCGGEISYYSPRDQREFLSPEGLYGRLWADQAAKYHLSFMIANDAPKGGVATPERFRQGSMATGYRFVVKECLTNGLVTKLLVTNAGIAPIYRDAWFAIGNSKSETSLRGLLPGEEVWMEVPAAPYSSADDIQIVSPCILPGQCIEFEAGL